MKSAKRPARRPSKKSAADQKHASGLTAEERASMREYIQEKKAEARRGGRTSKADGEREVMAKITALTQPDRRLAERLHDLIKANAPSLSPKTWYGMPAYARDGKVVCFFQGASKFKARYAMLGFSDKATLDDGNMWPVAFALTKLGAAEETRIIRILKSAVSGTLG